MIQATGFHRGQRVAADEIYDATDQCPVCHAGEKRQAVFRIQRDPDIDMLACPRCGAASASHMPKPDLLNRYYQQYYTTSVSHTLHDPRRFVRHLLRALPQFRSPRPLRILDFGGGDGTLAIAFARELQARAAAPMPIAIELVDYAAPSQTHSDLLSIRGHRDLARVDGPFDVLFASAIVEHLPDAHAAIRRFTALAGPRAHMYARTPFMLPLTRIIPGLDLTYPGHVHDMGSVFWHRFTRTFELDAEVILSRPSIVETSLRESPVRTALAHALKFPALAEQALFGRSHLPRWKFVGGWEAVIRFT